MRKRYCCAPQLPYTYTIAASSLVTCSHIDKPRNYNNYRQYDILVL